MSDEQALQVGRQEMKDALEKLVALIDQKYPGKNYDGFVKLLIYCEDSDGSGEIFEGAGEDAETLFEFHDLHELVEHLSQ